MTLVSHHLLHTSPQRARLVELDWLRVLAFGLLILYHTGMLYAENWGWHYKSAYSSKFLPNIMLWSNQWRMSLLFLISGAALSCVLMQKVWHRVLVKRIPFLLLPLVFGMLVIVVPQVYVEANSTGVIICPNFWHFWYIYLDQHSVEFANHKTIGGMQLTWNHLWFLPYIMAYTFLACILYPLGRLAGMRRLWQWIREKVSMGMVVFVPMVIFYAISSLLYENNPVTHNFVQDWLNHARSCTAFLLGFMLVRMPALWSNLCAYRWHFLWPALLSYVYTLCFFYGVRWEGGAFARELNHFLWAANAWLWMLVVVAWVQYWFTESNAALRYLNSGIFCFYILHQTLIIVFAYFIAPFKVGAFLEPIIVIGSVVISCIILFEIIKRLPVVRLFFGVHKF